MSAEEIKKVKLSLGISHNKLDSDIADTIAAAKRDLSVGGVLTHPTDDPLYSQAIKLYAKWQYNYQGEGERYHEHYEKTKAAMGLCGEYLIEGK